MRAVAALLCALFSAGADAREKGTVTEAIRQLAVFVSQRHIPAVDAANHVGTITQAEDGYGGGIDVKPRDKRFSRANVGTENGELRDVELTLAHPEQLRLADLEKAFGSFEIIHPMHLNDSDTAFLIVRNLGPRQVRFSVTLGSTTLGPAHAQVKSVFLMPEESTNEK
jgi:hypothetical protein